MDGRYMFGSVGMAVSSRMWHIYGVLDVVLPMNSIVKNLLKLL